MLQIDNKFDIGQELYVIQKCRVKNECPACKGEGQIIVDGNRFSCVTCYGTGRLHGQKKTYQVVGKDIIDKKINDCFDEIEIKLVTDKLLTMIQEEFAEVYSAKE